MIINMDMHLQERELKRLRERLQDAHARTCGIAPMYCVFCSGPLTEAERAAGLVSCLKCEEVPEKVA